MNTIKDIVVEYRKKKTFNKPVISLADLIEEWKKGEQNASKPV